MWCSQDGSSEGFIGEWAEKRGIRDQLVIATKYTTNYKYRDANVPYPHKAAYGGNNMKSLHMSVEASLKKLRTSTSTFCTCTGGTGAPASRRL